MFDFLLSQTLRQCDFEQQTEFLIPGFLAKNMITLVYADGGMGKSWLAFAVAKACSSWQKVIYLDFDNPLNVLKDRGVQEKLIGQRNIYYVQRSKTTMSAAEMLDALDEKATGNAYADTLIMVDSLRNFGDVMHDARAMAIMDKFMNLREAGATILILSHANKDGKNYQGSNNIRNSVDNMYRLKKVDAANNEIAFVLTPTKERAAIIECAFSVCTNSLQLKGIDVEAARMSADELDFISRAKTAIAEQPGINKKALLELLGYEQDDKTARNKLDVGEGKHWQSRKIKGVCTYQLTADPIATSAQKTDEPRRPFKPKLKKISKEQELYYVESGQLKLLVRPMTPEDLRSVGINTATYQQVDKKFSKQIDALVEARNNEIAAKYNEKALAWNEVCHSIGEQPLELVHITTS